MSEERRREKVRSAVAQAAALSEARKDIKRLRYGQQERRAVTDRDIRL